MKLTQKQLRQLVESIVLSESDDALVSSEATAIIAKLVEMQDKISIIFDEIDALSLKNDPKLGRRLDEAMVMTERGLRHLRMLLRGQNPRG